jgi:hypothetical protein
MRLNRVFQFLLLLLLAMAVYGGEVVESACFVDDISNDCIAAPASTVHKYPETALSRVDSPQSIRMTTEWIATLAGIPSVAPTRSSDLLWLLSIQRK